MEYALGLWFLLGILYPTVRTLWPFTLLGGVPVQWRLNLAYSSIGYTLLGHYLTVYRPRPRRPLCLAALLAGFLLTFGGAWAASAAAGRLEEHFLEGTGAGVFLEALGFWGLCQRASLPEWAGRAAEGPPLFTVPLISLLVLICGWGAYALFSRVPGVRRWLI